MGTLTASASFGSSPLTRGTPPFLKEKEGLRRFIPAYAGNSNPNASAKCPQSVHPRLRGELVKYLSRRLYVTGSSPLTRGTPAALAL